MKLSHVTVTGQHLSKCSELSGAAESEKTINLWRVDPINNKLTPCRSRRTDTAIRHPVARCASYTLLPGSFLPSSSLVPSAKLKLKCLWHCGTLSMPAIIYDMTASASLDYSKTNYTETDKAQQECCPSPDDVLSYVSEHTLVHSCFLHRLSSLRWSFSVHCYKCHLLLLFNTLEHTVLLLNNSRISVPWDIFYFQVNTIQFSSAECDS